MPVDSTSLPYDKLLEGWDMVDDLQSEKKIKDAGTTYVPQLTGQSSDEYDAYLLRGSLFGAFTRTVKGLSGAILRKPPEADVPKSVEDLFPDMTLDGKNFNEVVRKIVTEDLKYGYYGVLIDPPPVRGNPKLALYDAKSILQVVTVRVGGETRPTMITLCENINVPKEDDKYTTEEVRRVRELRIGDDGFYEQVLHEEVGGAWQEVDWIKPEFMGKRPKEIPFVFFGSSENGPTPKEGPLLDLAYLNVKHFVINVDFFHALHFCGLPTPWAAGFSLQDGESLHIGSATAWISDNPQASCGMLQASADSVGAIETALDKLEKQMAVVGTRALEQQRRGTETAEGLLIRQTSDFAVLSNIATCVENGMEKVLSWMALGVGASEAEIAKISVRLNKDYTTGDVDPQVLTSLFVALQNNSISVDTFLMYLKSKEVLPAHRTIQEEKDLILSNENMEIVEKMFGAIVAKDVVDNRLKSVGNVNTNGQEE